MALYEAKRAGRNKVVATYTYALSEQHVEWRGVAPTNERNPIEQPINETNTDGTVTIAS